MLRWIKSRYSAGLAVGLGLIVGPVLLLLIMAIPALLYQDDCFAGRCEHWIVQAARSFGFGLFLFAPVLMILGSLIVIVTGAAYGIKVFRMGRSATGQGRGLVMQGIGLLCAVILLFLAYVPGGPDGCSRVLTDTGYEICLEDEFADLTISETRQWLTANGYTVGSAIETDRTYSRARDSRHANNPDFGYDLYFQAFRDFGRGRSIPYGTMFNRLFARIPPAPGRFELNIYADDGNDDIMAVDAWWGFSFL